MKACKISSYRAHSSPNGIAKSYLSQPPHNKFVEAYVREDAEHACESESEREYAVAFRMKIPRSVYNEYERENLADDVSEEPNERVLRYPSYRAHTTSYFPFANARMRPKYFVVVCVRMRKMCICDEI